jgi:hypothetical protein
MICVAQVIFRYDGGIRREILIAIDPTLNLTPKHKLVEFQQSYGILFVFLLRKCRQNEP